MTYCNIFDPIILVRTEDRIVENPVLTKNGLIQIELPFLKKFQDNRKAFSQKIETFQAQQKQKKKDLFAEMEQKLKEELEKK